mgnify:CR=1 FL=1
MIRKIFLITLIILQFGCGYKIANNSNYYNFQILSFELTGEKKIIVEKFKVGEVIKNAIAS